MLTVHSQTQKGPEYEAAILLGKLAAEFDPDLVSSDKVILEIFASVQCFGEKTQDIDLLVMFADYRPQAHLFVTSTGSLVHSFCAIVEVKGHQPTDVSFEGANCSVMYRGQRHDVTGQSERQKYSLKSYIERNKATPNAPRIVNLIWLTRVANEDLPRVATNIIGMDASWAQILEAIAMLAGSGRSGAVETFSSRVWMSHITSIFAKRLEPSKIDRRRLEAVTKAVLDRDKQAYAKKLGEQLLVYRGRGGTGKTIRLLRTAYQSYDEMGLRVVVLTYNKALVADIRRLLALLGVRDVVGEGSISIKTIHSFMYAWLETLGVLRRGASDFLSRYEHYKREALTLLEAAGPEDIAQLKAERSRDLAWDLVLIDESQDWPETERDLIYKLYGHERVVIADGVDQFVRSVERVDWRDGPVRDNSQVVNLKKSLRLKSSLCLAVSHFAKEIEYGGWNLEPVPEAHGGKIVVVVGDPFGETFHRRLIRTAESDGNRNIDLLLCVPPAWVIDHSDGKGKESLVARKYREWGFEVWDAVDPEMRDEYPTSLDQFRVVQYDSCRGLEGWVVVCFGLDAFFEHKQSTAEIAAADRQDIFFEQRQASIDYAKRWLMIPLTRAIDTLVIHVEDPNSYVGKSLRRLREMYPHDVQWVDYAGVPNNTLKGLENGSA